MLWGMQAKFKLGRPFFCVCVTTTERTKSATLKNEENVREANIATRTIRIQNERARVFVCTYINKYRHHHHHRLRRRHHRLFIGKIAFAVIFSFLSLHMRCMCECVCYLAFASSSLFCLFSLLCSGSEYIRFGALWLWIYVFFPLALSFCLCETSMLVYCLFVCMCRGTYMPFTQMTYHLM